MSAADISGTTHATAASGAATAPPSGSNYESLLRSVSDLQADLAVALSTCAALRQENEGLRLNYDRVGAPGVSVVGV